MPETGLPIQSTTRRPRPEPEAVPIAIIYEDDSLIAIDKAPGMVVHPTYKNWSGTLLNGVLWHVRHRPAIEPSIVTRLDKDTSGLVLVALGPSVHAQVQRDGATGLIRKQYLAAVCGTPDPARGSISLPLARSPEDRRLVVVTPTGQDCRTDYELLSTTNGCSLVRCELITGRTHQIPGASGRARMADRRRRDLRSGAPGRHQASPARVAHRASSSDHARADGDRSACASRPARSDG